MKTFIVAGLLLVGVSGQAFSMGHPHNLFAARKQMRAKSSAVVTKPKTNTPVCSVNVVQMTRNAFSKLVVDAFSSLRSMRSVY